MLVFAIWGGNETTAEEIIAVLLAMLSVLLVRFWEFLFERKCNPAAPRTSGITCVHKDRPGRRCE